MGSQPANAGKEAVEVMEDDAVEVVDLVMETDAVHEDEPVLVHELEAVTETVPVTVHDGVIDTDPEPETALVAAIQKRKKRASINFMFVIKQGVKRGK